MSVDEPTPELEHPSLIELGSSPGDRTHPRQSLGRLSLMHSKKLIQCRTKSDMSGVPRCGARRWHEAKPALELLDVSDVLKMHRLRPMKKDGMAEDRSIGKLQTSISQLMGSWGCWGQSSAAQPPCRAPVLLETRAKPDEFNRRIVPNTATQIVRDGFYRCHNCAICA